MTNQEAIASLRTLCHNCKLFPKCAYEKSECFKAIEMAISALQAQDVPDINVGNMISREELFEELNCINLPVGNETVDKIFSVIENIPSAQPEIIRCKDCKHSEHWYRDKSRCFLWNEEGMGVFDDGFCNYAERRTDGSD